MKLRSAALIDQPLPAAADELDYPNIINRALPDSIRILGWSDVNEDFNARYIKIHTSHNFVFASDLGRL